MERLTEWKDDKKLLAKAKFRGDFGSQNILQSLAEYENLEEQGLLLKLPCKVGDKVYVIAKCNNVNLVLDGTLHDSNGGLGTATGWHCPYELNDTCPHIDCDDCKEFEDKTAVFADTVVCIYYDETGIALQCGNTNVCGDIGEYIFLTREEAEQKLKEIENAI